MIELRAVSKRYGQIVAVRNLDLKIESGEVFGFLGPNGAGKTTTIKIITGLLQPTSGSVLIDGLDVAKDPERAKSRLGYIPDKPYLYEKLTGLEFVTFVGGLYGMTGSDLQARARKLLGVFGIGDRATDLIESYSHGMKQKTLFAAALVHRPSALVVDEPMVGLDPRSARLVKKVFRELASAGVAVFLSTHTLEVAEAICDRIGIIHRGELIAIGRLDELRAIAASKGGSAELASMAIRLDDIFLRLTEEEQESALAEME
ncbi:MAG: ABC transporter ATP-binding protein [Candidatus Schekmanbacteria bacterium]|nr:ABC transporter ATP-binding protein [Candidatus Schekmanbacteria bacterium]